MKKSFQSPTATTTGDRLWVKSRVSNPNTVLDEEGPQVENENPVQPEPGNSSPKPLAPETFTLRCPRCSVRPVYQELETGICNLCNLPLEGHVSTVPPKE